MARLKQVNTVSKPINNKFIHEYSWTNQDGFEIVAGELIKIKGQNTFGVSEWGVQFKVKCFTTNIETNKQWVDCYEMYRGRTGVMRSFPLERIKRIPKKRGRRVNRTKNS